MTGPSVADAKKAVVAEVDFDDEEDEEEADVVPFFDLALLLSPSSSIFKSLV
jgi:hypothetical protein